MEHGTMMWLAGLTVCVMACAALAAEPGMDQMWDGEASNVPDAGSAGRGELFRNGNYAMFVHWGIYSHIGNKYKGKTYYGIGEWIMNRNMAGIPVEEYKAVAREFNPVKFNAREWVQLAKDAGMKYIVITSKHHDGFAMYDSDASDFNIVDATPFERDPMKELAAACKEAGIGFGFYYSHNQDWTAPGGHRGPAKYPDGKPATFADYFREKCKPQVEEITSRYGPMEIIWFDTPGKLSREQTQELVKIVRKNQPNALISGRIGMGMGDYSTRGDMEIPEENHEGMWESVDTTNDSWAYAWYDDNWKTPKQIVMNVIATVARGGTYMLNVGPRGDGTIPERAAEYLRGAGKWIKRYPAVVYGAGASPWKHALPWGDVTVQDNTLYLSVADWPRNGKLYLPGLKTPIASAVVRDGKSGESSPVPFSQKSGWTVFDVPLARPDDPVAVVAVTLKGAPEADPTHGLDPALPTSLTTLFAEVAGAKKSARRWMEKFGEWKIAHIVSDWQKEGGKVTWDVDVFEPGVFRVDLNYAGKDRLVWVVETGEGARIQNQLGASHIYTPHTMGLLEFKKAGRHVVSVQLLSGDPKETRLKAITFTAVE